MALAFGLLCHGSFLIGVSLMALGLHEGLTTGLGRLHGASAFVVDLLLLLQFPLLHSLLLSARGRPLLRALAPRALASTLAPTTFATVAALQLVATFALWSPSGIVWWRPVGLALVASRLLFAGSWLFLVKALVDAKLGLQTGWIGWTAAWNDRRPDYGALPTEGTFRLCRQPIYLGFALTLWTGPVWTPDHLSIALLWTTYCVVGPVFKERRFAARHGSAFAEYRARVPYLVPRILS